MSILTQGDDARRDTNSYTAVDLMERARRLRVSPAFAADQEHAHAALKAGKGLPKWADRFVITDDDGAVILDGDHGRVTIGCVIVFGDYAEITSKGVLVMINGRTVADEADSDELRAIAADLIAAADAMDAE